MDNFSACSDFLNLVLNAHIVVATANVLGCDKVKDITLKHLIPEGEQASKEQQLRYVEGLARKVVASFAMYNAEECQLIESGHGPDGIFNYACTLMNMGMLARNMQDASSEGDGERVIRCWRFLFLHYKAAGHSK